MDLPPAVERLAEACRDAGGRAWLVGGFVRDRLLAEVQDRRAPTPKDLDVEVHGIEPDDLAEVLAGLGRVDEVGRSFGVFKLSMGGQTIDVGLPRRDSDAGPGHRGIAVHGDPHMGVVEAARRRDLTVNAMLLDPLTGELADPYGGREDLAAGRLRAVDADTFLEDPLRAVRVVQFAGRFAFHPTPELVALCRRAPLDELPSERIWMELRKLLLRSARPSIGLQVGRETRVLPRVLPELDWDDGPDALDAAVDRAAAERAHAGSAPRPLAVMLGALLHRTPLDRAEAALERLRVHRSNGYPLRQRVLHSVAHWRDLVPDDGGAPSDTTLRELAEEGELAVLGRVAWAASGDDRARAAVQRAGMLGILHDPLPRLIQGRDLLADGMKPGPELGRILAEVRRARLQGRVGSREEALALARSLAADLAPDLAPRTPPEPA